MKLRSHIGIFYGSLLFISLNQVSLAGGSHDTSHSHQPTVSLETEFGRFDTSLHPTIKINISMSDEMRFTPSTIKVKKGDIVEFHHTNHGNLLHEFVLGTVSSLTHHAELMRKDPTMAHDKPNMVHVAPGETASNIWQFSKTGEFAFGCLIPGHYEAGMRGVIIVGS